MHQDISHTMITKSGFCTGTFKRCNWRRGHHWFSYGCTWRSNVFYQAKQITFEHIVATRFVEAHRNHQMSSLPAKFAYLLANLDDVMTRKSFPYCWPFAKVTAVTPWWRHQMETFSRSFYMFSLICAWINGWVNNREASDFETPSRSLWRHCRGYML